MSPLLYQFPPLQDKDPMGVLNRRQSVRNDNSRDISLGEPSQSLLDLFLILPVQGRSGLVQDEKLRVFAEGSSDSDPLFLPTGQLSPAWADIGLYPFFHLLHEVPGIGLLERVDDLPLSQPRIRQFYIILNSHSKKNGLLSDIPDLSSQVLDIDLSNIFAIDCDAAIVAIIVPHD